MRALVADGLLPAIAADRVDRLAAFSSAIGNTDAHLGNYSLLFDDDGRAQLAPSYDVLPMVFAPRHDELPDDHIPAHSVEVDDVAPLVDALVTGVIADPQISAALVERWLTHVGRRR